MPCTHDAARTISMAEPGPVDAPCDLGAWRELYAKLNVPWRDPATGAVESAPRRSTPAFAPPVTAPQAPPADGWRDDGAVESAFDSLIGADSEQREAADAILCRRRRTTPALLYAATDSRDGATAPAPEPQPAVPKPRPKPAPKRRQRVDKVAAPSRRPALPGCLQPPRRAAPTMESLFGDEEEAAAPPPPPAPAPVPPPPPPPPREPAPPPHPGPKVPRRLQPRVGLTTFSRAGTSLRPRWGTVGARPSKKAVAPAPAAKRARPAAPPPPAAKKKKKPRLPACLAPPLPPPLPDGVTMEGLFGDNDDDGEG